jgi:hypothetical protein
VSGVSTGALIAPFTFLGSEYDDTLQEVYTSGVAESLLDIPSFIPALFGAGLFGNIFASFRSSSPRDARSLSRSASILIVRTLPSWRTAKPM